VLVLNSQSGVEDLAGLVDDLALPERFPAANGRRTALPIAAWEELAPQIGRLHNFVILVSYQEHRWSARPLRRTGMNGRRESWR
jgi:hypothetical protein